MQKLLLQQARNIQLAVLGLLTAPENIATKEYVLEAIRRMSVLQIDTISVVNRSPYLVLYSRLGAFENEWLMELLEERTLFEYWSHEACFLPIEDYPLYKSLIDGKVMRWYLRHSEWISENREGVEKVLDHIKKHGPVMSSTFTKMNAKKAKMAGQPAEVPRGVGLPAEAPSAGWWNWKFEKIALEMLFSNGTITVFERKNFHRVYDLTERAIPQDFMAEKISFKKVYETFIERTVKHLGITKKSWVHDYFRIKKTVAYPVFEKLLKKKLFVPVEVEGFDEPLFVHKDNLHLVESALRGKLIATHISFLSPFDPLVWDRKRALELFNFDYRIECYTPASKRIYGYFTLPILYKGQLIGRMDAKAHRADQIFEVKALHFEKSYVPDEKCLRELMGALFKFAEWHGTPKVMVTKVSPAKYKPRMCKFEIK